MMRVAARRLATSEPWLLRSPPRAALVTTLRSRACTRIETKSLRDHRILVTSPPAPVTEEP
eukprot:12760278-Prorocentrum_lima.AAC.1